MTQVFHFNEVHVTLHRVGWVGYDPTQQIERADCSGPAWSAVQRHSVVILKYFSLHVLSLAFVRKRIQIV